MKKINAFILIVVSVVVAFASCKDKEPKLTMQQYLVAATNGWVFESIIYTDPLDGSTGDLTQDTTAFKPCDLDNAIIFTSDFKYTVAGNTKCKADEDAILDRGGWAINGDNSQFSLTSDTEGPLLTLVNFSIDADHIIGLSSSFAGRPVVAQITMKKK